MTRRRKFWLFGSCGLIAIVVVCFFCLHKKEPSYNGRTLSQWLDSHDSIGDDNSADFSFTDSSNSPEQEEAAKAICQIGTNAVPFLLRWFVNSERTIQRMKNTENWPALVQPTLRRIEHANKVKRERGAIGLMILGTNAVTALPSLAAHFNKADDANLTAEIIQCFGSAGLDFFIDVIREKPKNRHRAIAIYMIGQMRNLKPQTRRAVPLLLDIAKSGDDEDSVAACDTLGRLGLNPEDVVPVLAAKLHSTNTASRFFALEALQRFSRRAKAAVPELLPALKDADPNFRAQATNALRAIASEVLTNKSNSE